jgi:hypothetical protein
MSKRITEAQRLLLEYLRGEGQPVLLLTLVNAGYSRARVVGAVKAGLADMGSTYHVSAAASLAEFDHAQLTTCYVEITDAGRAALERDCDR